MKTALLFISLFFLNYVSAQTLVIKGTVSDKKTGEKLPGALVHMKATKSAALTDYDGAFILKPDSEQVLPLIIVITYLGYDDMEIQVTDVSKPLLLKLSENKRVLKELEIKDSRITERQKQAPLTVETMDAVAIKQTPAANFYEGLALLKGVDMVSASIGFKIINTRGFNSTSPVRSLQLIDGVDNQSPGLNFSLGNFLGASELDVQKVDLVVGASSAYFGPNAFNGVINMQTKSPFQFPGLSMQVKSGERNLLETSLRWAQVFKDKTGEDKFAYKFNLFYMHADDWHATNYDATSQSPVAKNNPGGYDAVNVYGDEYTSNYFYRDPSARATDHGIGYFLRDGYKETDMANYNSKNLKLSGAAHYKLDKKNELIYGSSFGTGTTIYQGDNRFSLKDILFFQNKIELRQEGKYFIRAYTTKEDAGNSYDIYQTGILLQNGAKSDAQWSNDYTSFFYGSNYTSIISNWAQQNLYWIDTLPVSQRSNAFENYLLKYHYDSLLLFHNNSRAYANTFGTARFEPGTARYDSAFNAITSTYKNAGGSKFFDQSALYHVAGEYKFKLKDFDLTTGGNFRLYAPYSKGTIFLDTLPSQRIYNREFGIYLGIERKLIDNKLKISVTVRGDKNENFNSGWNPFHLKTGKDNWDITDWNSSTNNWNPMNWLWSPAASAVFVKKQHVFRFSASSAIRNPTLTDQYINLNVGRATLLGNLKGFDSLVTIGSLLDALYSGQSVKMVYFNVDPVKPERAQTIEFGYRGNLRQDLFIDVSYYFSWYEDFIGYKIGAKVDWPAGSPFVNNVQVYRVATNAKDIVTTQGFTIGINYFLKKYLGFVGNFSWNKLDLGGSSDPIIPAYNTPEHKYNLGINGRDIHSVLGNFDLQHWAYGINWKWQEGFIYQGSPQFTGPVPAYGMLDAQVSKTFPALYCTLKIGASNLLDNRVYQVYGGPSVGRLAYISLLFELDKWK